MLNVLNLVDRALKVICFLLTIVFTFVGIVISFDLEFLVAAVVLVGLRAFLEVQGRVRVSRALIQIIQAMPPEQKNQFNQELNRLQSLPQYKALEERQGRGRGRGRGRGERN